MPGRASSVSRWERPRSSSRCCGGCGDFTSCGRSTRRRGSWGSNSSAWPSASTTRPPAGGPSCAGGHFVLAGRVAAGPSRTWSRGWRSMIPSSTARWLSVYGLDPRVWLSLLYGLAPVVAWAIRTRLSPEPRGDYPGPGAVTSLQPGAALTMRHGSIMLRREGQAAQERAEAAIALSTEQGFAQYLAGDDSAGLGAGRCRGRERRG